MLYFDENTLLGFEYEKTKQLLVFEKLCKKMSSSKEYEARIRRIFRQAYNDVATTKSLIKSEYEYDLNDSDAARMACWIKARLQKLPNRKQITQETKERLVNLQSGKCAICGNPISANSSDSHVDHVVPWVLVGDELDDNYQVLCETCNRKKNSDVSYLFKAMIHIS